VANSHHDWGATMDSATAFFDCPAFIDRDGAVRCGLPAAVEYRYKFGSTDGPLACVKIRCPQGHWFSGPAEALTVHAASASNFAADAPRAAIA
jgi:hypothetical protein